VETETSKPWNLPTVSVSAIAAPAEGVLLDLGLEAKVNVLVPPKIAEVLVTAELADVPAQQAFELIAEQLKHVAVFSDGVVNFIDITESVRRFIVLDAGFTDTGLAETALRSVVGEGATVTRLGERVVVAGSDQQLDAARRLAVAFQSGADGWLVEVRVVALSKRFRQELGVDFTMGGGVGVSMDAATGHRSPAAVPVFGARASVLVDAVLKAAADGSDARLLRNGRLFVLEGSDASLQQGDVVPVPRRTVSDAGTVQTVGYDRIETGFNLAIKAKRVPGGVELKLRPSLSSIASFVEQAPVTSESSVECTAMVRSGDYVVLSGLEATDLQERVNGIAGASWLGAADKFDIADASLVVLLRATRVVSSDQIREGK